MTSIEQILSKNNELSNAKIIRMLKSKKNTVYLITLNGKRCVLKKYSQDSKESITNELNLLSFSKDYYRTPEILSFDLDQRFILMTYIAGENICDLINSDSIPIEKKTHIIQSLAVWFFHFHKSHYHNEKSLIHGDATLRNFIYNTTVVGLDFEESHIANPIVDIANICASILTTNPQYTSEKKELQHHFIQTYEKYSNLKMDKIENEIKKAISTVQKRRKKKVIKRN
jgi:tRNA A-37 threonylcarbamoyl transferase component Bud32